MLIIYGSGPAQADGSINIDYWFSTHDRAQKDAKDRGYRDASNGSGPGIYVVVEAMASDTKMNQLKYEGKWRG